MLNSLCTLKSKLTHLKCRSISLISELRLGIFVIINVRDQHSSLSSNLRFIENRLIMQIVRGKYNIAIVTWTQSQDELKTK